MSACPHTDNHDKCACIIDDTAITPDDQTYDIRLRELIARLECIGMPEFSECGVMARLADGTVFELAAIRYDRSGDTVWLELGEF